MSKAFFRSTQIPIVGFLVSIAFAIDSIKSNKAIEVDLFFRKPY